VTGICRSLAVAPGLGGRSVRSWCVIHRFRPTACQKWRRSEVATKLESNGGGRW
jgi:hypothetical protein